jgi:ATP-dependent RNA helicase DeaD
MLEVARRKTGKSLVHGLAMSTALHLAWSIGCQSDPHTGADVPAFENFHLHPSIAATLDRLGWSPDDPFVREGTPTVARGHNLVAVTPPAPAYATPTLGALFSRRDAGRLTLLLVPTAQLEEWGALAYQLARDAGLRVQATRGAARAMRHLRAQALDVLVTTPEIALTLVSRSALPMEMLGSFFLAWPEMLPDEDAVTPLMQDLPKDAQRIIYTSEPERADTLIERYARKALAVKAAEVETPPAGPVRTVGTAWSDRVRTLADVIELLDPASLAVWTVDRRQHEEIAHITASQPGVQLVTGDAPPVTTVVAFDLPTGTRLRQLLAAGEVVLLVPPGTERHVTRIAAPRRPLQLPGVLEGMRSAEAAQRATILKAIEAGQQSRSLFTLAPLFERYEPQVVAAALYDLWMTSAPAAGPAAPEAPATAKVYVGWGKKDGANPNELVAVLTKELRVDRGKIGRIELREAYSLIELPVQEVEAVAAALNGKTIRKKRVAAHVDRGAQRGSPSKSRV